MRGEETGRSNHGKSHGDIDGRKVRREEDESQGRNKRGRSKGRKKTKEVKRGKERRRKAQ
jgi:hypothetical protein